MVQIDIIVRGPLEDENCTKTSFFAPEPISLADIEEFFPFMGKFHFRYKFSRDSSKKYRKLRIDEEFVWVDLILPDDLILVPNEVNHPVEVQATVIFYI